MIEVFSTNVTKKRQAEMLLRQFRNIFPGYSVNFDLEDCDNILRVENENGQIDVDRIRKTLRKFGFSAEVLPDIPKNNVVGHF